MRVPSEVELLCLDAGGRQGSGGEAGAQLRAGRGAGLWPVSFRARPLLASVLLPDRRDHSTHLRGLYKRCEMLEYPAEGRCPRGGQYVPGTVTRQRHLSSW